MTDIKQPICPSCREPLAYPSGDGCANMTKHTDRAMSDDLVKMCRRLSKYAHAQLSSRDLERIADRIEELEAAIKRQAGAARTLRQLTLAEVQHLSDMDRSEYFAAQTLNSERDANAILTDRIEELEAKLVKAVDAISEAIYLLDPDENDIAKETGLYRIVTAFKELSSVSCANLKGQDDD